MFLMIVKAIILGIVEGITEFLPISSTGHLIIVEEFVKLNPKKFKDTFDVVIQLGAILSVVVVFWDKLWPFSGSKEKQKDTWILWSKVIIAVIPAVVIGLKFDKIIKAKLFNPMVVAVTLVLYGVLLIIIEDFHKRKTKFRITDLRKLDYKTAIFIGCFQCLAMVPGTSRSAATIIGAMLLGLARAEAAEFAFFLAIPTMFGATAHDILKTGISFTGVEWITVGVGFVVSFIVALAVIKVFMGYIKRKDFKPFGYYRIVLGILVLVLAYFGIIG